MAIPMALASHFVMDALPHYGDNTGRSWFSRHFNVILGIDALICALFLIGLLIVQPANWLLLVICAVVAVSPDFLWLPYYLADLKGQMRHESPLARLFKWIQWGERPWGIYIEVVWLIASLGIFISIVG
jgi:hypothetical protein